LRAAAAVAGDGVELSAACDATYVNKRVGANEQWAITWDLVAHVSGNVFKLDGGPPSFVECWRRPGGDDALLSFDCYGSPACRTPPCAAAWTSIPGPTVVQASFLYPPGVDPADPRAACTKRHAVCAEGCPETSVQSAIDHAPANSFVRVGRGTWDGDVRVVDKSVTVFAEPGAVVRGTGAGAVVSLRCDREPAAFVQWIGGTITGGGMDAPAGTYGGGGVENVGCAASIQDARIEGNSTWGSGGGIANVGDLLLGRTVVVGNTAGNGGGIANERNLQAHGVAIDDNASGLGPVASRGGGGIANGPDAVARVIDSSITGNDAPEGCCGGGGILNRGELELARTDVAGNRGDGVRNEGGDLAITGSTVAGNDQGGIWNREDSIAVIEASEVRDNRGRSIGGLENEGSLALRDVRVSGNRAGPFGRGGGILDRGSLALDRVTISGNSTEDPAGAGLYVDGGTVAANLVTVTGNTPRNCVGVPFPCP
ncbi:MAG: right-handed parallel beta-helix repeat-containing protein, partial [Alphaproteobacteria bacterium]